MQLNPRRPKTTKMMRTISQLCLGSSACLVRRNVSSARLRPSCFLFRPLSPHAIHHSLPAGVDATLCKECKPLARIAEPTSGLPPASTKIKKILHILKTIDERSEGVEKTIIFSQFTTMLDLIEPFLDAQGIDHVRCSPLRHHIMTDADELAHH